MQAGAQALHRLHSTQVVQSQPHETVLTALPGTIALWTGALSAESCNEPNFYDLRWCMVM